MAYFDDLNPANNWVRTDYESTGADGRGSALFWDGDDLYAIFTVDGTQGSSSEDFRRASSDNETAWTQTYGQGGGAKASVIAEIDPTTGEMTNAAYLTSVLSNGKSNTLLIDNVSENEQGNLEIEADAWYSPRDVNGEALTKTDDSLSSPFDYTIELTSDLKTVVDTSAVGWE